MIYRMLRHIITHQLTFIKVYLLCKLLLRKTIMSRCPCGTPKFNKVTHVIFDLDGLLLDTEKMYTRAAKNVVREYGKDIDWSIKSQVMGLNGPDSSKLIVRLLNLPMTWDEYHAQAQEQYHLILGPANLMPGAERLVRHLHTHGIPIAVATSSSKESADLKSANHQDLFSLFNHIVTGGSDPEVKHGKPSPDIFLICAARFPDNPKPEECLVLEDAPNGVAGAIAAGMQCIMVPDPHVKDEFTQQATLVLKSLEVVKLEQFGLPPMKKK